MAFQTFRTDFADVMQPAWLAEPRFPEHLIPIGGKVVASAFAREDAMTLTLAAGAVTSGTGKTVTFTAALTYPVPAGTILDFGSGKFVTFPTGVAKGATSVTDASVAANLAGGESTTYVGTGKRRIEAGTLVGRTFTERDAGTGFGPYATADDEVYLLAFQVEDADVDNDATFLRPETLVKENWLPGFASYTTQAKAALRATYRTLRA